MGIFSSDTGMNFDDFMVHPNGKHQTGGFQLKSVVADFTRRYDDYRKEHGDEICKLANVASDGTNYYIHLTIESESDRDNTYDLVFGFKGAAKSLNPSFRGSDIKVFSNSPSFVFQYAYVYNKKNLLITGLKDKYDRIVLKDAPKVRNSTGVVLFDKSVYYGLVWIKRNFKIFSRAEFMRNKPISFKKLKDEVRTSAKIMIDYNKAKLEAKENKEVAKQATLNRKSTSSDRIKNVRGGVSKIGAKAKKDIRIKPKSPTNGSRVISKTKAKSNKVKKL